MLTIKQGDLLPSLVATVAYDDGSDLGEVITVETPVTVTITAPGATTPLVDEGEGVVSAVVGGEVTVTYEWAPGDTDTPGHYHVLLVFLVGGRRLTAPTKGSLHLQVERTP